MLASFKNLRPVRNKWHHRALCRLFDNLTRIQVLSQDRAFKGTECDVECDVNERNDAQNEKDFTEKWKQLLRTQADNNPDPGYCKDVLPIPPFEPEDDLYQAYAPVPALNTSDGRSGV